MEFENYKYYHNEVEDLIRHSNQYDYCNYEIYDVYTEDWYPLDLTYKVFLLGYKRIPNNKVKKILKIEERS